MEFQESKRDIFDGDKYLFPVRGGACLSTCKVLRNGTKIGSVKCQSCEFLLEYNHEEKWVSCSRIIEAVGEFSVAMTKRKEQGKNTI